MSPGTDAHACGPEPHDHGSHASGLSAHGDSAGVPWEGRSFEPNPHAADDGSADPALLAALLRFRAGEGSQVEVVDAFRAARVLIPLIAEKGEEGVAPSGLAVDKTQELSIVTVAAPDGRRVQ
ncbi:SseB family protein, partial [Aeromonas veronii]|nr:SseB family protein [Aeromonas veronii]